MQDTMPVLPFVTYVWYVIESLPLLAPAGEGAPGQGKGGYGCRSERSFRLRSLDPEMDAFSRGRLSCRPSEWTSGDNQWLPPFHFFDATFLLKKADWNQRDD